MRKHWLENDHFEAVQTLSDFTASKLDWTTSNELTLFRIVLVIPMALFFLRGYILLGCLLYAACCLLDFFDGAVARFQEAKRGMPELTLDEEQTMTFIQKVRFRGKTFLGKTLDPLSDKCVHLGALIPLGWGYVHNMLLVAAVLTAASLTAVRPIKRWLGRGDSASNRLGKFKMWSEIVAIAVLVFIPHVPTNQPFTNGAVAISILLGFLSLGGHIHTACRQRSSSSSQ